MHPYLIEGIDFGSGSFVEEGLRINNAGTVVSSVFGSLNESNGSSLGFTWRPTIGVKYLTLPFPYNILGPSVAAGINDEGDVVGNWNQHACMWRDDVMQLLPDDGAVWSYAFDINPNAVIAGLVRRTIDSSHISLEAVRWRKVRLKWRIDYARLPDDELRYLWPAAIDELGRVVGRGQDLNVGAINQRALEWPAPSHSHVKRLAVPPAGFPSSEALCATNGVSAGLAKESSYDGPPRPYFWSSVGGGFLGSLPGQTQGKACGMNSVGQIVGQSGGSACVWNGPVVTNLNSLIDPALGWKLRLATDINDRGQIVGLGYRIGQANKSEVIFVMSPAIVHIPPVVWQILFGTLTDKPGVFMGPKGAVPPAATLKTLLRSIPAAHRPLLEELLLAQSKQGLLDKKRESARPPGEVPLVAGRGKRKKKPLV